MMKFMGWLGGFCLILGLDKALDPRGLISAAAVLAIAFSSSLLGMCLGAIADRKK